MGYTVAEKILMKHIIEGELVRGKEIGIRIDQTLTQDATGTMAYLQFEAMDIPQVKTDLSVSYVDHNTLQNNFMNPDDHLYLQTVAAKHGIVFSKPGNGICHQVHIERFGKPGTTLLGSDSHTTTGGGIGQIAIGAGGLDVAVAMAGKPFYLTTPKIVNIYLTGKLSPFVSAKDIILKVLKKMTVKGGVGKIIEYTGPGLKTLSVPERATITNMGAELGATTSVFPSDEITKTWLKAQGRENDWREIIADSDAVYDEVIEINLSELEPLVAQPHMPDRVVAVKELAGKKVDQVLIGSCTNSSYKDLVTVAEMLRGKKINQDVSFGIAPGSRQVLEMIANSGYLEILVSAGARILESTCGFCIGMGMAPRSGAVSVRTNNRNFEGRSGTMDAGIYLVSPETAVACALSGEFSDPRELQIKPIKFTLPKKFIVDDSMLIFPGQAVKKEVLRGPNIKPCPKKEPLAALLTGKVLIKLGDNITTDHIMPAGSKVLPLRSNIPEISKYVFEQVDKEFYKRAMENKGGFIVGGENYGQGSSREHAALAPMYLGIIAVITKSFARIHKANLVNFGIIPLTFRNPAEYERIMANDIITIENVIKQIQTEQTIVAKIGNREFELLHDLTPRQKQIIIAGGMLNYVRS